MYTLIIDLWLVHVHVIQVYTVIIDMWLVRVHVSFINIYETHSREMFYIDLSNQMNYTKVKLLYWLHDQALCKMTWFLIIQLCHYLMQYYKRWEICSFLYFNWKPHSVEADMFFIRTKVKWQYLLLIKFKFLLHYYAFKWNHGFGHQY